MGKTYGVKVKKERTYGGYTASEVCSIFRGCKNPQEQMMILMDLTRCKHETLEGVLESNGYDLVTGKRLVLN